jgi:hypothetical protein
VSLIGSLYKISSIERCKNMGSRHLREIYERKSNYMSVYIARFRDH